MSVTIYHNPRCSKSRQTLQILRDHDIDPVIVEYVKQPPDKDTLGDILRLLGLRPRQLLRSGESIYTENGLDDPELSDDDLLEAMVANPILIERPIVIANGRAVIGRPPEKVLEIL